MVKAMFSDSIDNMDSSTSQIFDYNFSSDFFNTYLLTLDLMLEAVPYSSANILAIRDTWSLGGITNEIILVPFLCTIRTIAQNINSERWEGNYQLSRQQQRKNSTYPRAICRLFINFLIFHISTFKVIRSSSKIHSGGVYKSRVKVVVSHQE